MSERSAVIHRATRLDGERGPAWDIAVETPVEIGINGRPFAVMLATPADLEDLGVGFAFTEGVVTSAHAIDAVVVHDHLDGIVVDVRAAAEVVNDRAIRSRRLEGRSGCGLCGVENLAAVGRGSPSHRDAPAYAIDDDAVLHALGALRSHQPLNQATHTTHAAAWCDQSGNIRRVREDVGRHNALDKLAGALLRDGTLAEPGFVAMSSRLSFELVCKAGAMGAAGLATVSAPTSLALEVAEQIGLPVCCLGPQNKLVWFSNR